MLMSITHVSFVVQVGLNLSSALPRLRIPFAYQATMLRQNTFLPLLVVDDLAKVHFKKLLEAPIVCLTVDMIFAVFHA